MLSKSHLSRYHKVNNTACLVGTHHTTLASLLHSIIAPRSCIDFASKVDVKRISCSYLFTLALFNDAFCVTMSPVTRCHCRVENVVQPYIDI